MDDWIQRAKWHGTWLVGFAAVFLTVLVLVLSPSLRTTVNANQGVVSIVLTALLVILYFGQFHLQSRQMRFENAPHVEIQEYNTDGKQIELWLSNLGNGVATDIEIETCIGFDATNDFAPGCASTRLRRVGDDGDPKQRVGNSLRAGEHHVRFVGEPVVDITPQDSGNGWGLVAATERLAHEDVDEVTFSFAVTNNDLLGSKDREDISVVPFSVELDGRGMNIEEIQKSPKLIEGRKVI